MALSMAAQGLGYVRTEIGPHGLRAMASPLITERDFQPDWSEKRLAHGEGNRARVVYNQADSSPAVGRRCGSGPTSGIVWHLGEGRQVSIDSRGPELVARGRIMGP